MPKSTIVSYIRCDCSSTLRVRGDDSCTLKDIESFFNRHSNCNNIKKSQLEANPIFCEHANEVPAQCPCESGCYCKTHTCAPRLVPQDCSREYGHFGPCNGWPCTYVRKKLDFARNYGMSGAKFAQLTDITDQEALDKLERMFGKHKTPCKKSKHYSKKEILTFKPLRNAIKRFFDSDGPYV